MIIVSIENLKWRNNLVFMFVSFYMNLLCSFNFSVSQCDVTLLASLATCFTEAQPCCSLQTSLLLPVLKFNILLILINYLNDTVLYIVSPFSSGVPIFYIK